MQTLYPQGHGVNAISVSSNGSQHKGQSLSIAASSSSFEPQAITAGTVSAFRTVSDGIDDPRRFGTLCEVGADCAGADSIPLSFSSGAACEEREFGSGEEDCVTLFACECVVAFADLSGTDPDEEPERLAILLLDAD